MWQPNNQSQQVAASGVVLRLQRLKERNQTAKRKQKTKNKDGREDGHVGPRGGAKLPANNSLDHPPIQRPGGRKARRSWSAIWQGGFPMWSKAGRNGHPTHQGVGANCLQVAYMKTTKTFWKDNMPKEKSSGWKVSVAGKEGGILSDQRIGELRARHQAL